MVEYANFGTAYTILKTGTTLLTFYKYHGTGNDFIIIDNRNGQIKLTNGQVAHLCNRHFAIGADGLMLLEHAQGYDFRMVYYNSDGGESSMCGNGGRCMVSFARSLGIIDRTARFLAADGEHTATINDDGRISLHMQDVQNIRIEEFHTLLNTGSPHYVQWVPDVKSMDVFKEGRKIRNRPEFQPGGVNVNFMHFVDERLYVRTYERGVEDETMSCGTGVTAAAIAASSGLVGVEETEVETPGGVLKVSFTKDTPASAVNVILTGPATFVFKGEMPLP